MLKSIFSFLAGVLTLILRFARRKDRVEEVLSDTPVIDQVKQEAERKAAEKFGPRPKE